MAARMQVGGEGMTGNREWLVRGVVGLAVIALAVMAWPRLPVSGAPAGRQQVKVTFLTASTTFDVRRWEATLIVANAWRSLGMDVEVVPFQDFPALLARVGRDPFNFDAFVSSFVARPERLGAPFHRGGRGSLSNVIAELSILSLQLRQASLLDAQIARD